MKTYKCLKELIPFLHEELEEKQIEHYFDGETCTVNCSGNEFHFHVKAARAAKLTYEKGYPHISNVQLCTKGVKNTLLQKYGTNGFVVI